MDQQFAKLVNTLAVVLDQNGNGSQLVFDKAAEIKKYQDIYDLCDREAAVKELQKKATGNTEIPAKDWVPLVSQIDFMSTSERDLRMRYRGRIQSFRLRLSVRDPENDEKIDFPVESMKFLVQHLQEIEAS